MSEGWPKQLPSSWKKELNIHKYGRFMLYSGRVNHENHCFVHDTGSDRHYFFRGVGGDVEQITLEMIENIFIYLGDNPNEVSLNYSFFKVFSQAQDYLNGKGKIQVQYEDWIKEDNIKESDTVMVRDTRISRIVTIVVVSLLIVVLVTGFGIYDLSRGCPSLADRPTLDCSLAYFVFPTFFIIGAILAGNWILDKARRGIWPPTPKEQKQANPIWLIIMIFVYPMIMLIMDSVRGFSAIGTALIFALMGAFAGAAFAFFVRGTIDIFILMGKSASQKEGA